MVLDLERLLSSLTLTWGEDTDTWEVAWITGGERFVACDGRLEVALRVVLAKACERFTPEDSAHA
jgi:adenylosuccinate lyase